MKSKKSTEETNKTGGEKFYSIPLFSINQKLNSIISGILVGFCMVIGITCSGSNGNNGGPIGQSSVLVTSNLSNQSVASISQGSGVDIMFTLSEPAEEDMDIEVTVVSDMVNGNDFILTGMDNSKIMVTKGSSQVTGMLSYPNPNQLTEDQEVVLTFMLPEGYNFGMDSEGEVRELVLRFTLISMMSVILDDLVFTVSSSIPADPRGCYSGDITVTMSAGTLGAEIFYTLDDADVLGNGQATNSDSHDVQLTASNNSITKTLRAYATDGLNNSLVKEQVFLLKPGNDTDIASLLEGTLANSLLKDAITGSTIGGDGNLKITTKNNISLPSSLSGCIQILWESELPYILDHSGEVQLPLPSRRDVDIALTGTLDIYQTDNATLASDTAQLDVTLEHGDQVHPSGTVEERTKFMREGKWGLFIHYVPGANYRRTYWGNVQDHENPLNEGWDAVISGIDTDTLARQLFEVGAGWLVFTIKHDEISFSAFNDFPYYDKNMKRIASNQTTIPPRPRESKGVPLFDDYTTTRDLLRDILDSLAPYGIKFVFYYPAYPRNIWSWEGFVPWWGNGA